MTATTTSFRTTAAIFHRAGGRIVAIVNWTGGTTSTCPRYMPYRGGPTEQFGFLQAVGKFRQLLVLSAAHSGKSTRASIRRFPAQPGTAPPINGPTSCLA